MYVCTLYIPTQNFSDCCYTGDGQPLPWYVAPGRGEEEGGGAAIAGDAAGCDGTRDSTAERLPMSSLDYCPGQRVQWMQHPSDSPVGFVRRCHAAANMVCDGKECYGVVATPSTGLDVFKMTFTWQMFQVKLGCK